MLGHSIRKGVEDAIKEMINVTLENSCCSQPDSQENLEMIVA